MENKETKAKDISACKILESCLDDFIQNFIKHPYIAYTEHGHHAYFYTHLYNELGEKYLNVSLNGLGYRTKVCLVQKEYPTRTNLSKTRRQHWDISLLSFENIENENEQVKFDELKINAVVEFGLNESLEHFYDDFFRLTHKESNVQHKYLVHLFRVSESSNLVSSRDESNNSLKFNNQMKLEDELTKNLETIKKLSIGGIEAKNELAKEVKKKNFDDNYQQLGNANVTIIFGWVSNLNDKIEFKIFKIKDGEATEYLLS